MPITWCFRFSKEAWPWGSSGFSLDTRPQASWIMVSVNASVPPVSAISRREVAFHTQNAGCMLSSCRQWLFHLHQCHHCPQPLGSLARGRHGGLPGILQVYPYVCCIQVVFNIYINIYIKSQLSIFILFAFYIHGNNVYQLFFSDIFYF